MSPRCRFIGPPRLWPIVINDWVRGLSMRDYAERYLGEASPKAWDSITSALAHLRHRFNHAFERGGVTAEVTHADESHSVVLTLAGHVDDRFFREARRRLARMLRNPKVSLTLRLEHLDERQQQAMTRILERLGRYGERFCVRLNEQIQTQLAIDPSRVRMILDPLVGAP